MKNWQYIKFEDSITYIIGGDWGKEPNFADNGFVLSQVIRATDLKNWNQDRGEYATLRKIDRFSLEKRRLNEGDIIFEISGGSANQPVGRAILIDGKTMTLAKNPLICSNFFRLIRFTQFLKPEFANYYLQHVYLKGDIEQFQKNTTNIRNFQFSDFANNYTIPIPTISEQTEIVSILDEIFEKFELAKKQLEKTPRLLERYRQSVLERAVSGELTEDWREENNVEFDWVSKNIAEITIFIGSGVTPTGGNENYKEKGIPFLRSQNIYPNRLVLDKVAYISEELHNEMKRTHLKENDVLLNITGSSIGRSAIIPKNFGKGNVNQHVCILRVSENILPIYLSFFLNSPIGQKIIMSSQTGVTRQGLNYSQLREISIKLPYLSEQTEIVNRVEKLLKKADEVEAKYQQAMKFIDKLQTSILAMAFRGELSELQTDDEPVSVLLEKIKTEKEYLEEERKEIRKKQAKIKSTMAKQEKSIRLDIIPLLKEKGGTMSATDLLEQSKFNGNIDDFFAKVKELVDNGSVTWEIDIATQNTEIPSSKLTLIESEL